MYLLITLYFLSSAILLCSCLNLRDVYLVYTMLKFESIIQIFGLNLEIGTDRLSRNIVKPLET